MRRRAGEKTSGEEETNGNNKAGDGGESKHAEIAHIQEMKSSRSPWGRGLLPGGACPVGVTCDSKVAAAARPQITKSKFSRFGDVRRKNRHPTFITRRGRRLPGSLSGF